MAEMSVSVGWEIELNFSWLFICLLFLYPMDLTTLDRILVDFINLVVTQKC